MRLRFLCALALFWTASTGCNAILGNERYGLEDAGDDSSNSDATAEATTPVDGGKHEAGSRDATSEDSMVTVDDGGGDESQGDGACASLADIHSCGSCTNDCTQLSRVSPTGIGCAGGQCSYTCAAGYADCADAGAGCGTTLSSSSTCGACGVSCGGATPVCASSDGGVYACASGCTAGETNCSNTCANLMSNPSHCGTCAHACPAAETCQGGTCACPTTANPSFCGTACTNTKTDSKNCASCGSACTGGQQCVNSGCQCPANTIMCNGTCQSANICGGCGTITLPLGGACGTCGTYVCNAGKTALTCNDPGTTNSCPTYCDMHPAPSGVAASDYQCLDFDKGLPSSSVWAQDLAGGGTLAQSAARFFSSPDSMVTTVTGNGADRAALKWSNAGAAAISNVLVSLEIEPVTPAEVLPSPSDELDLITLDSTSTRTYLYYAENADGNGYNGLGLSWELIGTAAMGMDCTLGTTLNLNQWNSLQLNVVASGGPITITLNGANVACPCCPATYGFGGSNSVTVTVGAANFGFFMPSYFPWTSYFDNVQATIRR